MSVFNRISDIINSNLNTILEQAEDPEKIVRMITQEMEETLVEVRSSTARYLANKKQITQRLRALKREVSNWETKAELAIEKGRDDLAKSALRERSRFDTSVTAVEGDLISVDQAIEKLTGDAAQLESKLQSARVRQKALIVRGQTVKSRMKVKRQVHDVSVDEAFSRFESYERKLDEMEGEIESYDLGTQSLSTQIEDLEKDEFLNHELEALKSRMTHVNAGQQIGRNVNNNVNNSV
ncbi:MAG: phage shock protein PspA [bacterium]|nr:phage shock protein PspA [Gammaproteobacteria bacterium]HIL98294.1 phage shock protein PspA [Pseudomonadales bacterium]